MDRKKLLSFLIGIGISILCFGILFRGVEWGQVGAAFRRIEVFWCVLAIGVYLLGHLLRGIRCSWILRPHRKLSWFDATQVVWIGYAANNLLPARLGEVVRAYTLAKREHLPQGITLSTLFLERIFDGLAIVGILGIAASYAPPSSFIRQVGWFAGFLFVSAMLVVLVARLAQGFFLRLLDVAARLLPQRIGHLLHSFAQKLLEGTACLRPDRYLLGILGLSLLIWIVEGLMFLVLLVAFGLPASLMVAFLAMSLTNLGVLVPSTPGHVGTFHFFCVKALLLTGALTAQTSSLGLAYATLLHALQFAPVTLLGFWALSNYGMDLRSLWKTQAPRLRTTLPPAFQPSPSRPD